MNKAMDFRKVIFLGYGLSVNFLLIHIAMLILFRHYGVTPMVYVNIFSIFFYLGTALMLKKKLLWLYSVSVYLEVLLQKMPDYKNEPEGIQKLLPWSPDIQLECQRPKISKKTS